MGTVADFGPIPNPRANLAINKWYHEFANACQKQAKAEKVQVRKIVPRRPNQLLKGIVSQQPMNAQQRYGAELTKPTNQESLSLVLSPMPNCLL
jgi:hypothetical protein